MQVPKYVGWSGQPGPRRIKLTIYTSPSSTHYEPCALLREIARLIFEGGCTHSVKTGHESNFVGSLHYGEEIEAESREIVLRPIEHNTNRLIVYHRGLRPPRTFKEAKTADDMARKACGLDDRDTKSDFLLIHINELDESGPQPIEASVIDAQLSLDGSVSTKAESPTDS